MNYSDLEDSFSIDTNHALSQWNAISEAFQDGNAEEKFKDFLLHFYHDNSTLAYDLLNNFLTQHADVLESITLDVLCEQVDGRYLVKLEHFAAIEQDIHREVEKLRSINIVNSQEIGSSQDLMDSDGPYTPSQSVTPISPQEQRPKRNYQLLKQVLGTDTLQQRLDRHVVVRIHTMPDGEIGVNRSLVQTSGPIGIIGRANVIGGGGAQMRHVTPVALIESVVTNAAENIHVSSTSTIDAYGLATSLLSKIDHFVDIKENGFVIMPEECAQLVKDDNCPHWMHELARTPYGEYSGILIEEEALAAFEVSNLLPENREILRTIRQEKNERILEWNEEKKELVLLTINETLKPYLEGQNDRAAAEYAAEHILTQFNQHAGGAFPTEGNTPNYEIRVINKKDKSIISFASVDDFLEHAKTNPAVKDEAQYTIRLVNNEGNTIRDIKSDLQRWNQDIQIAGVDQTAIGRDLMRLITKNYQKKHSKR